MRPPDEVRHELVMQWRTKADADFRLAEHLHGEQAPFAEAIAFHCQQAAEKYLKALLTAHQRQFPKTHDIAQLLDLLAAVDAPLTAQLRPAEALTPYGVMMRYPGDAPELIAEETEAALAYARLVRQAVLSTLPA